MFRATKRLTGGTGAESRLGAPGDKLSSQGPAFFCRACGASASTTESCPHGEFHHHAFVGDTGQSLEGRDLDSAFLAVESTCYLTMSTCATMVKMVVYHDPEVGSCHVAGRVLGRALHLRLPNGEERAWWRNARGRDHLARSGC